MRNCRCSLETLQFEYIYILWSRLEKRAFKDTTNQTINQKKLYEFLKKRSLSSSLLTFHICWCLFLWPGWGRGLVWWGKPKPRHSSLQTHAHTEKHQGQITTQLAATQHAPANVCPNIHLCMKESERVRVCARACVHVFHFLINEGPFSSNMREICSLGWWMRGGSSKRDNDEL